MKLSSALFLIAVALISGGAIAAPVPEPMPHNDNQPHVKVEIASTSHPFYTGTQKIVDSNGKIEKFRDSKIQDSNKKIKKS